MSLTKAQFPAAVFIFFIAFYLRVPLADNIYQYSFESDSQPCVEITRSFYFFFKSPRVENFPQTLSHYPNYSDGDYIATALLGNALRPLCKMGIIKTPLNEGDNSLVIFSMRWGGALFDALAAVFAYLVLLQLTGNGLVSLIATLLYYLLNQQTLNFDLIRIDHFVLFTANLTVLAALLLYRSPAKKKYALLCGIAMGLVTGTKINFPFYLLLPGMLLCFLAWSKRMPAKNFALLFISFSLSAAFMYQRWLMYPERVPEVLSFTLDDAVVWTAFWGTRNHGYYLWDQFFNHGNSAGVALMLVLAYLSFIICFISAILNKKPLYLVLCAAFILQSASLAFSPKVGRYGIIMPLWIAIFLSYGICLVLQYQAGKARKAIALGICVVLLLPNFIYAKTDYEKLCKKAGERQIATAQTRLAAYRWIKNNILPGSAVAMQAPRVSNPAIFELPFVCKEDSLTPPFLYEDQLLKFYPPDPHRLPQWTDYVIIDSKETDFHFFMLTGYYHDTLLALKWRRFYRALDSLYPSVSFSSAYTSYGLKSLRVYRINDSSARQAAVITGCTTAKDSGIMFCWNLENSSIDNADNFQIQIAADSAFKWLISGSRDGFPSRYRVNTGPYIMNNITGSFVPPVIMRAFVSGAFREFPNMENPNSPAAQRNIQSYFGKILIYMIDSNATFSEANSHFMRQEDFRRFKAIVDSVYGGSCNLWNCDAQTYLKSANLSIDPAGISIIRTNNMKICFKPDNHFSKGKKYYWRVRLRNAYNVMSAWSSINSLTI